MGGRPLVVAVIPWWTLVGYFGGVALGYAVGAWLGLTHDDAQLLLLMLAGGFPLGALGAIRDANPLNLGRWQ